MSKMVKPPLNRVVNRFTTNLIVILVVSQLLLPYGNGDSSFGASGSTSNSNSNNGVGIFIHGTNLATTNIGNTANIGYNNIEQQKCPRVCTCTGQTVDCSHRDLQQVPRRIPLDAERL